MQTNEETTSDPPGIDDAENHKIPLNHIHCESSDTESDTENTISVNMISVKNDYEPVIYEQTFTSHIYENQLELLHNYYIGPTDTTQTTQKVNEINTVIKPDEKSEDARYLNSLIDESKCNWPIEPIHVILTKINGKYFTTADINSAYNQMPLDEQSRLLTQFDIGNQQYEFNRLFYGISIGPAAFSAFMSKIFRPLILKKNAITYLDDFFMQSQTKEEMFTVLEHYHKIFQNENLKAAPNKSHFFLTPVKFSGHNIELNTITPLKSRIDAIQKFQPPTNKKKIQEFLGMLNFLSKYV